MSEATATSTAPAITNLPARLPRFKRVKQPPRMVLTSRDQEILRQVYAFRLMTREQIERLLFPPDHGQDHPTKTNIARKRLRLLFHHGYLERIPTPIAPGVWGWRPVYRLSRQGAELIAAELGITIAKLAYWGKGDDKDGRASAVSLLFLQHALETSDVRIAVMQAAKSRGYTLEEWLDEMELKRQERKDFVAIKSEQGNRVMVPVIPDAYFVLHLGKQRAHFFLELDRATMSNSRWKRRILAYQKYIETGKYHERYKTTSLRILTVTTTPKRLASLQKTTANAGGDDLFWFTTFAEVMTSDVLSSPIWLKATDEHDSARNVLIS